MKIALFGGIYAGSGSSRTENQKAVVYEALRKRTNELYIHDAFFNSLPTALKREIDPSHTVFSTVPLVDMAFSVGGDGTFLRTATAVADSNIPVLGINTGRLGFLADIIISDLENTLDEIFSQDYQIEERSLLGVNSSDGTIVYNRRHGALNEVAILKQDTASMLSINTFVNDDFLTTYQADGLIIATPTGSTAYALSVGGPILMPESNSFVLAPIAPHNLTSRPLVIHDKSKIKLKVESRSSSFLVSMDGQSQVLKTHIEIEIFKADYTLKVVKRTGHTFYETLRDKLMWGVDVRK